MRISKTTPTGKWGKESILTATHITCGNVTREGVALRCTFTSSEGVRVTIDRAEYEALHEWFTRDRSKG